MAAQKTLVSRLLEREVTFRVSVQRLGSVQNQNIVPQRKIQRYCVILKQKLVGSLAMSPNTAGDRSSSSEAADEAVFGDEYANPTKWKIGNLKTLPMLY